MSRRLYRLGCHGDVVMMTSVAVSHAGMLMLSREDLLVMMTTMMMMMIN